MNCRKRANAEEKDAYTLEQICDEWAREFYFEGRRRMDLIRFGKIWQVRASIIGIGKAAP